jgi:hypothetical protein
MLENVKSENIISKFDNEQRAYIEKFGFVYDKKNDNFKLEDFGLQLVINSDKIEIYNDKGDEIFINKFEKNKRAKFLILEVIDALENLAKESGENDGSAFQKLESKLTETRKVVRNEEVLKIEKEKREKNNQFRLLSLKIGESVVSKIADNLPSIDLEHPLVKQIFANLNTEFNTTTRGDSYSELYYLPQAKAIVNIISKEFNKDQIEKIISQKIAPAILIEYLNKISKDEINKQTLDSFVEIINGFKENNPMILNSYNYDNFVKVKAYENVIKTNFYTAFANFYNHDSTKILAMIKGGDYQVLNQFLNDDGSLKTIDYGENFKVESVNGNPEVDLGEQYKRLKKIKDELSKKYIFTNEFSKYCDESSQYHEKFTDISYIFLLDINKGVDAGLYILNNKVFLKIRSVLGLQEYEINPEQDILTQVLKHKNHYDKKNIELDEVIKKEFSIIEKSKSEGAQKETYTNYIDKSLKGKLIVRYGIGKGEKEEARNDYEKNDKLTDQTLLISGIGFDELISPLLHANYEQDTVPQANENFANHEIAHLLALPILNATCRDFIKFYKGERDDKFRNSKTYTRFGETLVAELTQNLIDTRFQASDRNFNYGVVITSGVMDYIKGQVSLLSNYDKRLVDIIKPEQEKLVNDFLEQYKAQKESKAERIKVGKDENLNDSEKIEKIENLVDSNIRSEINLSFDYSKIGDGILVQILSNINFNNLSMDIFIKTFQLYQNSLKYVKGDSKEGVNHSKYVLKTLNVENKYHNEVYSEQVLDGFKLWYNALPKDIQIGLGEQIVEMDKKEFFGKNFSDFINIVFENFESDDRKVKEYSEEFNTEIVDASNLF